VFHALAKDQGRHSFFGLLKHILINLMFILIWITTFKNGTWRDPLSAGRLWNVTDKVLHTAWRIDASIRPLIDVNRLEQDDHKVFGLDFVGIVIQCCVSVMGYAWMYALTRRSRLSILAALPPFLLNVLYAGTHTLCPSLDVFVCLRSWIQKFIS
jgi:hypothetical protein